MAFPFFIYYLLIKKQHCAEIKIFLANGIFFLTGLIVKCMKVFCLRCLCLGVIAFSAVSMQAKEIKVSFDAGKYKNTKDWQIFIADLCDTLKKAPNYENGDTFDLKVQNGDIFKLQPDTDYGHYLNKEESQQTEHTKILSKIRNIEVDTEEFSTSSLMKIFPWTQTLRLPNAKYISGFSESTCTTCTILENRGFFQGIDLHFRVHVFTPLIKNEAEAGDPCLCLY